MNPRSSASCLACKAPRADVLVLLAAASLGALVFCGTVRAQTLTGATVQLGQTSLSLPQVAGSIYVYGMGTGGAAAATNFAQGPYAQVIDQGGQVVAGLAMTASNTNSFTTECADFTVGGVGVSGFKTVSASYAANNQQHPTSASDSFLVSDPAVVVVFAIAGGEDHLELQGLPGLQIDAQKGPDQSHGIAIAIAHAELQPGRYKVTETTEGDPGRDPAHEGDLIGVFVFTGGSGVATVSSGASGGASISSPIPAPPIPAPPIPTIAPETPAANAISFSGRPVTVTVPAQAGPWNQQLNTKLGYGFDSQAPVVVKAQPGTALTLTYLAGTVSIGGGWPSEDANGDPQHPLTANNTGYPSAYLEPLAFPVNIGSLLGAFAMNGVVVGRPFKVGDGPLKVVVPSGANELLLGVDDDQFGDNQGAWTIQISSNSTGWDFLSARVIGLGIALLVVIAGGVLLLRMTRPATGSAAPQVIPVPVDAGARAEPSRATSAMPPAPGPQSRAITSDTLDKLAKLKQLFDAGLITSEEFQQQKAKLLGHG